MSGRWISWLIVQFQYNFMYRSCMHFIISKSNTKLWAFVYKLEINTVMFQQKFVWLSIVSNQLTVQYCIIKKFRIFINLW